MNAPPASSFPHRLSHYRKSHPDIEKGLELESDGSKIIAYVEAKEGSSRDRLALALFGFAIATASLIVGSVALARVNQTSNHIMTWIGVPAGTGSTLEGSTTLHDIKQREVLKCGISLSPGFGEEADIGNGQKHYYGFDVDLCRAIAAAIFDEPEEPDYHIEYTVLKGTDRFKSLHDEDVDLLACATTHTMDRDVYLPEIDSGLSFSSAYFYDGHRFAGLPQFVECAENHATGGGCKDLIVCVDSGSTHLEGLADMLPGDNIKVMPSTEDTITGLIEGHCNAIFAGTNAASDAFFRGGRKDINITIGKELFSNEPLSLVTRGDDPRFSDFVDWILQMLLNAEAQGVTQKDYAKANPEVLSFGTTFSHAYQNAIRAVGNYNEVYENNLAYLVPRGGLNDINQGSTGLILGSKFGGSLSNNGPLFHEGSTLDEIKKRGFVSCGVIPRAGFAQFDASESVWSGMDVDFCRALSAAIFDGEVNNILIHSLTETDKYAVLSSGLVDVLARVATSPRDGDAFASPLASGYAHTNPYFYDGLVFGGIDGYGKCADNLDSSSNKCEDLTICVTAATADFERTNSLFLAAFEKTNKLFSETNFKVMATHEAAVAGLVAGECNALAGGAQDISKSAVLHAGLIDPAKTYEIGAKYHTAEPLAIVTRKDDDAVWSDFVYWVVEATFNAEENGITRATAAEDMPVTNLFGELYRDMLKNAVQAVGSYGELYDRNLQASVPRAGLNMLNSGSQPQLLAFS